MAVLNRECGAMKSLVRFALISGMVSVACMSLYGQAMQPDPDPPFTDSCGRSSTVVNSNGYTYETFITSAVKLSPEGKTATLPLFKGYVGAGISSPVYYILTDTSDCQEAQTRGLNYVPKLKYLIDPNTGAPLNKSVQQVTVDKNGVHFTGTADFSPVRIFTPNSPDGWPPAFTTPGSVGDSNYTPFITYKNATGKFVVFNASQVSNSTGIKDFIPSIDYTNMNVTFNLVMGIYNFDFVMYLRMDASDTTISGFEGGIYAPNPELSVGGGLRSFTPDMTSRQTIMPVLNGIRGTDQIYNRQGLMSSALGEGDPFNIMGATPGEVDYSPIWDITPVVWTDAAIAAGKRQRLRQDDEVRNFVQAGLLTGLPGASGPFNADLGLTSLGIVSNCPIMLRVMAGLPAYKGGR